MVVKFDSLNRFERPLFHLCNPGAKYEEGALTRAIGILPETSDEEIQFEFNTASTLSLRAYKRKYEDPEQDRFFADLFDGIQNRRLLFVDDIGFFMITNVVDGYEDEMVFKDIQASSLEAELMDKQLPYIEDGTYSLQDMITKIGEKIPMWKFTYVDESIKNKYRTFEDVATDQNVLDFLLEDMQEAYECIFLFDPIYRSISVYDQKTYVHETGIQLTRSDLIQSSEQESNVEDFYTALTVLGDEDLSIAAVNPLGTTTIYDFTYYLAWMPSELSTKVSEWQKLVWYYADQAGTTPAEDNYPELGKSYAQKYTEYLDLRADCERLETIIDYYQRAYDNIAASKKGFIGSYNNYIENLNGIPIPENYEQVDELQQHLVDECLTPTKANLEAQKIKRDAAEKDAQTILDHMGEINAKVNMKTYFTPEEYEELSCYIAEAEYTDEYVIITDEMTFEEQYDQYATLYSRAVDQLAKISQPTEEYSIGVENFLFQKSFKHMSEQLETGCIINVEMDNGDIAPLFLTGITINYEDLQLELVLGNRYLRIDPQRMFRDVLGSVKRSANSLSYMKDVLDPVKKGELDRLSEELLNSRNLTKDKALGSRNQQVLIDDSGYTGRLLDPATGDPDPRQLKIINNLLVFTDDAWDTCKTALGELTFRDAQGEEYTKYGLNAEVVMGDLILGSELHIMYQQGDADEQKDLVESLTQFNVDMQGLDSKVSQAVKKAEDDLASFKSTEFKQTADRLELLAEFKSGEDGQQSLLGIEPGFLEIIAENIVLTGYVTFNNLSDPPGEGNKTHINGGNIDTGEINAQYVSTGILQSKDNGETFYLDLDKGELRMKASSLQISMGDGTYQDFNTAVQTSTRDVTRIIITGYVMEPDAIKTYGTSGKTYGYIPSDPTIMDSIKVGDTVIVRVTKKPATGSTAENTYAYICGIVGRILKKAEGNENDMIYVQASGLLYSGSEIKTNVIEYATSTSSTVAPESGWSTTVPAYSTGVYLWTREKITYSDDSYEYINTKCESSALSAALGGTTTEQLFNQLTQGGKVKGLFMGKADLDADGSQEDYFYVNADYVRGGVLQGVTIIGNEIHGAKIYASELCIDGTGDELNKPSLSGGILEAPEIHSPELYASELVLHPPKTGIGSGILRLQVGENNNITNEFMIEQSEHETNYGSKMSSMTISTKDEWLVFDTKVVFKSGIWFEPDGFNGEYPYSNKGISMQGASIYGAKNIQADGNVTFGGLSYSADDQIAYLMQVGYNRVSFLNCYWREIVTGDGLVFRVLATTDKE